MVVDQWVKRSGDPQFKSSQPQNTPSVNCIEKAKLAENGTRKNMQKKGTIQEWLSPPPTHLPILSLFCAWPWPKLYFFALFFSCFKSRTFHSFLITKTVGFSGLRIRVFVNQLTIKPPLKPNFKCNTYLDMCYSSQILYLGWSQRLLCML